MPLALALDALAARLTGTVIAEADPQAAAYALREAQALARADVIVAGWGGAAETAALAAVAGDLGGDDLVDALYDAPPLTDALAPAVALVETLAALFPGAPAIAAAVRGPCSLAAGLDGDPEELAEAVVDLVTPLALALGAAGASLIVVVEDAAPAAPAAHAPLVRALAHQRLDAVLVPDASGAAGGHGRVAGDLAPGTDCATADPALWLLDDATFAVERERVEAASATGTLVLGGMLPGDVALERLAT